MLKVSVALLVLKLYPPEKLSKFRGTPFTKPYIDPLYLQVKFHQPMWKFGMGHISGTQPDRQTDRQTDKQTDVEVAHTYLYSKKAESGTE